MPGMPAPFSGWKVPTDVKADMPGENNETVLADLGPTPEDIAGLYRERVIVHDPLLDRADPAG